MNRLPAIQATTPPNLPLKRTAPHHQQHKYSTVSLITFAAIRTTVCQYLSKPAKCNVHSVNTVAGVGTHKMRCTGVATAPMGHPAPLSHCCSMGKFGGKWKAGVGWFQSFNENRPSCGWLGVGGARVAVVSAANASANRCNGKSLSGKRCCRFYSV